MCSLLEWCERSCVWFYKESSRYTAKCWHLIPHYPSSHLLNSVASARFMPLWHIRWIGLKKSCSGVVQGADNHPGPPLKCFNQIRGRMMLTFRSCFSLLVCRIDSPASQAFGVNRRMLWFHPSTRWGCNDRWHGQIPAASGPQGAGGWLPPPGGVHGFQHWSPLSQVGTCQ